MAIIAPDLVGSLCAASRSASVQRSDSRPKLNIEKMRAHCRPCFDSLHWRLGQLTPCQTQLSGLMTVTPHPAQTRHSPSLVAVRTIRRPGSSSNSCSQSTWQSSEQNTTIDPSDPCRPTNTSDRLSSMVNNRAGRSVRRTRLVAPFSLVSARGATSVANVVGTQNPTMTRLSAVFSFPQRSGRRPPSPPLLGKLLLRSLTP